MNFSRRQIAGGACIVGGIAAYLWLMSAELVPAAVELTTVLGAPVSVPVAWGGLTAAALAVALGLDRALARRR